MIHYIIVKWNSDADKKSLSENARALYDDAVKISGVHRVDSVIYG